MSAAREHHTRLSELMDHARLTDPALAELTGTSKQQVFKLRRGDRKMSKEWADRLAPHLGIEWTELMERPSGSNGDGSDRTSRPAQSFPRATRPARMVTIPEVDLQGEPDPNFSASEIGNYPSGSPWTLPGQVLPGHVNPEKLFILTVLGDAMEPDFPAGSRVMVDISPRQVASPSVYVLWDEAGFALKQVEHLIGSNPPTARISSINPRYASYERPLEDVQVRGRVVGRWVWK